MKPALTSRQPRFIKLFTRQASSTQYPGQDVVGPAPRSEWLNALNSEKQAGRIPSLKPSLKTVAGNIEYPRGMNGSDPNTICSWTIGCRSHADITDAPDGMMGISFDDGPEPASSELMAFLRGVNQTATHFMIGSRIQQYPQEFLQALKQGDHIAVHTWSHPFMTTLNDTAVLGELGWTLQIIFDLSGGRLPAFWRPPYGDVDNRVRAIAKNVFGLETVIWNQDTNDWCLTPQNTNTCGDQGPANQAALEREMSRFISMPKSPGLIILEHELTIHSVRGFTTSWPAIKQAGWDTRPIPSLFNSSWYQNADGAFDQVVPLNSFLGAGEIVKAVRARPASVTNDTTANSNLTKPSNEPSSHATPPLQTLGKTSGASRKIFKMTCLTTLSMQALILALI